MIEDGCSFVRLLILEGDGIGPEIVQSAVRVLKAVSSHFDFPLKLQSSEIGLAALERSGTTFPSEVLHLARHVDGIILGPVSHNDYPSATHGGLNPSGELRRQLDLYANIRPARARRGVPTRIAAGMDLVVVRENTEGFYADRCMHTGPGEFMPSPDIALAIRKISRQASLRIAETAFELARTRRRQVTAVHKGNVLRVSDGLFLNCVREVADQFKDVQYQEILVDAMAALLVRDPSKFDVIVTTNMFGDILSDLASELAGGLGMAASLNIGQDIAVAQAQHGSAPDIAGLDVANPFSLIGSVGMLLGWLAERRSDNRLEKAGAAILSAIDFVVAHPVGRTLDIGGSQGTRAVTDHLIHACLQNRF